MRWFRSNIRIASMLALFALTLQFALSLGHVHADANNNKFAPSSYIALEFDGPRTWGGVPDKPAKAPNFADYCAICAIIHMADSSLLAEPPSLLLPNALMRVSVAVGFDVQLFALPRLPSQARAPPVA